MTPFFTWLHTNQPSAILFNIGPLSIRWYGVVYLIAITLAIGLLHYYRDRIKLKSDQIIDLVTIVLLGGLIGARLYAVLINGSYYVLYPLEIVMVWRGGLAIHGGLIGGLLALLIWRKWKKYNHLPTLLDIGAVIIVGGQMIGRWGNYFNQELFGRPSSAPWSILIEPANRPAQYLTEQYFTPLFLYESIANGILFVILLLLFHYRRLRPGMVTGLYLIGYGIIRLVMENWRIDATIMIGAWRWPTIVSWVMILAGFSLIFWLAKWGRSDIDKNPILE